MIYLPEDPVMLLSTVNMYLRDRYRSFEDLVEDQDADGEAILSKLGQLGFRYDPEKNRFV